MRLDPGDNVDGIAEHIVIPVHHITQVDADPQPDVRPVGGTVALLHRLLDPQRALHRVKRAGELGQNAIAERLHHTPAKARDDRADDLALLMREVQGELLVPLRQRGVADHVRQHHGRQLTAITVHSSNLSRKPWAKRQPITQCAAASRS